MGNVPQQVGQLTRKQSSPAEDVDGAAAVLFPLLENSAFLAEQGTMTVLMQA